MCQKGREKDHGCLDRVDNKDMLRRVKDVPHCDAGVVGHPAGHGCFCALDHALVLRWISDPRSSCTHKSQCSTLIDGIDFPLQYLLDMQQPSFVKKKDKALKRVLIIKTIYFKRTNVSVN